MIRTFVGGSSILLFLHELFSIKQLPFDYHYHPEQKEPVNFKKGNYVMTLKHFQHVFYEYKYPKVGDLVLFEKPDSSVEFRIVEAVPKSYYYDQNVATQYYVPQGFVVLLDPQGLQSKMQAVANIKGSQHYTLF